MSDYSEITFHANEDWIFKSAKYSLSSESVANNFEIFRQDGALCDVDLVSGDTVVKAHRVVLAAACVYFETMFKSGLEECNRKSVPLPSIAPDVLSLVVEFIYSGQTVINGSTVLHLVDAANMLQLQELSVGCAQYLRKQLHPSNVVGIIRLAETHNLVQLAEEALSYAMSHWGVVVDGEEFVHLSLTMLTKLLTSDELVIDNEVQVLRAALRWLDHDPPSRREHYLEVLRQIRLHEVSEEELQEALITVRDPAIAEILKTFKIVLSAVLREPRPRTGSCLYVVGGTQSGSRKEAFRTALKFDGHKAGQRYAVVVVDREAYNNKIYSKIKKEDEFQKLTYDPTSVTPPRDTRRTYTRAWTQIAPMSAPRFRPGAAALGGRVYAVGGMNGKGETLASGEMYDPRVSGAGRGRPRAATGRRALTDPDLERCLQCSISVNPLESIFNLWIEFRSGEADSRRPSALAECLKYSELMSRVDTVRGDVAARPRVTIPPSTWAHVGERRQRYIAAVALMNYSQTNAQNC
ncbi:Actin-binding protein IPP [Eumeta japonica]|uniref:Actin-binding protein IPP n=1 Tax=Eumeta variegata TaxID=151549 RepID=A0A4C1VDL3_EUMVA|nr:Actin-binding protein IPP [Eumeta japonica]